MGDVLDGRTSNDEVLFDELNFVQHIREQNTEVDKDDDCLNQGSADLNYEKMTENNHWDSPDEIEKHDAIPLSQNNGE